MNTQQDGSMSENTNVILHTDGLVKTYGGRKVVDSLTLSVDSQSVVGLLGPNGAGKTTLMNILFGYYTCDEGQIFIKGKRVNLSAPKDAIGCGVGMIRQHFALVPSQTVLENIIVGAGSGNGIFLDLKSARRDVVSLQERFGLQVDPDAKIWTLSVGEQQKVEILKALYREVDILIMDEPTAAISEEEIQRLFTIIKGLKAKNVTVIYISHRLDEISRIAQRVTVLRDGQKVGTRSVAKKFNGHYVINGAKTWITNGDFADYITLAVRTGDAGHAMAYRSWRRPDNRRCLHATPQRDRIRCAR